MVHEEVSKLASQLVVSREGLLKEGVKLCLNVLEVGVPARPSLWPQVWRERGPSCLGFVTFGGAWRARLQAQLATVLSQKDGSPAVITLFVRGGIGSEQCCELLHDGKRASRVRCCALSRCQGQSRLL